MAETSVGTAAAVVTERTCGICLEDSRDPLNLPCGHSFCDGCLGEWRSRYGVKEEMRKKCPICRASIPPSRDMVATLLSYRAGKQMMEEGNDTTSEAYHIACQLLKESEEKVGADWDGVTVLEDNEKPAITMPNYIRRALTKGGPKPVLKWINANHANRTEDRVNAISNAETMSIPALTMATIHGHLTLVTLFLPLGADPDLRIGNGHSAIGLALGISVPARVKQVARNHFLKRPKKKRRADNLPFHKMSRQCRSLGLWLTVPGVQYTELIPPSGRISLCPRPL